MTTVEDALDALDLARAEPGPGLLEALFARFVARVAFESASKIVRDRNVADPEEKPRRPEVFWREHLELGAGGTCFARVAAFRWVLDALGFVSRPILGRVVADFDHAALLVESGGRDWICDVGFPLPALLPASPGETETALAAVSVSPTERGFGVDIGGVPEGPRRIELFRTEVSDDEFWRHWRRTFRPEAKFLREVSMRRALDNRVVSYAAGEVRVDDLHSRLTVPLPADRPRRLAEIFGVDEDLIARAMDAAGDRGPETGDATLTAYLEADADPADAFAAIASPQGYAALLDGVARVELVRSENAEAPWTLRLSAPEAAAPLAQAMEETVSCDRSRRRLEIERRFGENRSESFYETRPRPGGSHLVRGLSLAGPRDDLLRNDSLRGRLAGALAVDLLAWSRQLSRASG